MKLQTSIDFITADADKHRLLISSELPLEVLSSAVHNGGFTTAHKIISIHVPEDNEINCNKNTKDLDRELHENPELILKRAVMKIDADIDNAVGIMTHADVRNVEISNQKDEDIKLSSFVTAGVEVAATAGELTISRPNFHKLDVVGTINIVLLIDGNLTRSCMVDAMKTAIEAKTVALKELDVRSCFSGDLASGTVSDSIVVACTKRGEPVKYAGTATVLGELIGKSVNESLKKTLYKEQQITADRCIAKRLKERRVTLENLINIFLASHPKLAEKQLLFSEKIMEALSTPKVAPIVIAAFRLDEDIKMGLIPKESFDESTIIDLFQTAVIQSINKHNQLKDPKSNNINLDSIENLGKFVGKVLSTIMNSVYSNIVDFD